MNVLHTRSILFAFCILFFYGFTGAQDWSFKLNSKVELRSWKLSSVAFKSSAYVNGATIKLSKGSEVVSQVTTDQNGNFQLNIPANGDYILEITYPGYDSKKFAVSTRTVSNLNDANSRPSVSIVGMMVSKYAEGTKYLGLDQSHILIEYNAAKNNTEGQESGQRNYNYKLNMYDAEYLMIQRFCTANKLGDMALAKKNYARAEKFYQMALDRMGNEAYPKDRLKLVEEGKKAEKDAKLIALKRPSAKTASKKVIVSSPAKTTGIKTSNSGGKSKHKTRMVLGK